MPYCSNCGRQLAENEVCNCKEQQVNVPPVNNTTPPPTAKAVIPGYDSLGRPLFTPKGEPITYDENGNPIIEKKKDKTGCIIAVVIVLFLFIIILIGGAILVPAMLGYTKKAHNQAAIADVRIFLNSCNSALVELDEIGYKYDGKYIICSDRQLNKSFGDEVDFSKFYSLRDEYYEIPSDDDWFIVIEDGKAVYCAYDGEHDLATYPVGDLERNIYTCSVYNSSKSYSGDEIEYLYYQAVDMCRE